jgi:hypothetical protein
MRTDTERQMTDFELSRSTPKTLGISERIPGQSYPQHYPQDADPLGAPISIREAARVLGVSPWTVRQKYLPQGLPHLRSGPQGKLVFYRQQVIRWILERQKKGGVK